jgi:hypothetical protein
VGAKSVATEKSVAAKSADDRRESFERVSDDEKNLALSMDRLFGQVQDADGDPPHRDPFFLTLRA